MVQPLVPPACDDCPGCEQCRQNGPEGEVNQLSDDTGLGEGKHQGGENIADGDNVPHGFVFPRVFSDRQLYRQPFMPIQ